MTASASITIDIMKKENLVQNSFEMGEYLRKGLSSIDSDEIVEVRGYGLIDGIEMKARADEFRRYCLDKGVLVNVCHGNTVRLIPPLIIGKEHCDVVLGLLKEFLE